MSEQSDKSDAGCRRCGTCCEQGGPALHLEDRALVGSGLLRRADLVTVRAGEPAFNQPAGRVEPAPHEFLKIGGVARSWRCRFFDPQAMGCTVYRNRPLECRLLFCRDTTPLEAVIGRDLLTRRDLLAADDPVLPLLARQEKEIAYGEVRELLERLGDRDGAENAAARLAELSRQDLVLRELFLRLFPQRQAEELFLFGRPLFLVLSAYGIRPGPG